MPEETEPAKYYKIPDKFTITFKRKRIGQLGEDKSIVSFVALVESLSEDFTVSFTSSPKIGSPEPIYSYDSTVRSLTLSWKVMTGGVDEVEDTKEKIRKLTDLTYPLVNDKGQIVSPPIVELKFGHLTENYAAKGQNKKYLTGYIGSIGYDYQMSEAPYIGKDIRDDSDSLIPASISINITFTPINTGIVGGRS